MVKRIGVDLGGTYFRIGLINKNKILDYNKYKTPKNKKTLLKKLTHSIAYFKSKDVKEIGISIAGLVNNGVIKKSPNLPLNNFNLMKFLQKKFNAKIKIENDANCVALAEAKLGCQKKNFLVLTLGTGIGGGIIINNELYKGQAYAGELGHIILNDKKDLEYLWKYYRKLSIKYFGKVLLVKELLQRKDNKAKKILDYSSDVLAQAIANLINIFDPEIIILSGGVKETERKFLFLIKKKIHKYVFLPYKLNLSWTKLKHPGILGASLLFD